jgi:hypothetical protein
MIGLLSELKFDGFQILTNIYYQHMLQDSEVITSL